jgi:hypothetical protein
MSEGQDQTVGAGGIPSAEAFGTGVTIRITSNFDTKWFQVALEHERAALEARDRAIAAPDGSGEMAKAFDAELMAAMVAIAASAFAIDALYTTLSDMLDPADRVRAKDRVGTIVETFKVALELGRRSQKWQTSIPALFDQRDELVHFRGKPYEAMMHPTGKSNVSRENVTYTAETTAHAVDLALEVLTTAYTSPRQKHAALVKWSESAMHVPPYLESLHRAVAHER